MVGFWQAVIVALIAAFSGAITALAKGWIESRQKKQEKDDSTAQILAKLDELETKINGGGISQELRWTSGRVLEVQRS